MILSGIKPDPPKRVMGVDCSSNSFAWSIFDSGKLAEWGEIEFGSGDLFQRMGEANRRMSAIANRFDSVDRIVVEGAIYVQNKKTVIYLSYSLGSALSPLIKDGTDIVEVSPTEWQNFIGNKVLSRAEKQGVQNDNPDRTSSWYSSEYRRIRKQRTIDWVKDSFGVSLDSDNVADAIGLGWYGVNGV